MENEPAESVVLFVSRQEFGELIEKSVRRGLADAGLYLDDKIDREEARKDFWFLRRWRKAMDGAAAKIGYTVLAILTGGALIVIWAGLRAHLFRP
ncbi:hypothetical protein LGR54_05030 [Ancylobacter sp. Lp-2]|uniref:hypothetical protein n=1 Tax=Ancylobacter sp. Lp-2 TaxID=2881339 RepID=UPI001E653BEB|nr:hypothetical protein [Ancylobacter sp. Lp-2]MCB4767960.1 hypothetical protein [Ancylobacter sp. Lp-2]